ncbi:MAG: polysaccharide biosynthesis C-terminal domain-containing protein [Saprospiraceae bacterium]
MKKQFITNILLLFCINVLVKPFYVFFIETDVQNQVGTEDFGIYFYHLNFVFLFQFVGDFGLQTWNNQSISKNRGDIEHQLLPVFFVKIVLSTLWLIFILSGAYFLGSLQWDILFPICINLVMSSLFLLIRSFISGLGLYIKDSLLSALDKLLMIVILFGLLSQVNSGRIFTIQDFIYGQMTALFLSNVIAFFILWLNLPPFKFRWNVAKSKKILQNCIPYAIVLFLMITYNKMDGFLLGFLQNDQGLQAGIYAGAYRIYDAANMFLYIIPALVLPMFSNVVHNRLELDSLVLVVFRWMIGITMPILVISTIFTEDIIQFLYIEHIPEKVDSLRILMFAFCMVSFGYILGALSMAVDKVHKLTPVFISGLVICVISNIILIPRMGATGSAISTLITQVWVFIGQYWIVQRELSWKINVDLLQKAILYVMFIGILSYACSEYFQQYRIYSLVLCSIISLPLAFFLKLIEWSDLRLVLRK